MMVGACRETQSKRPRFSPLLLLSILPSSTGAGIRMLPQAPLQDRLLRSLQAERGLLRC